MFPPGTPIGPHLRVERLIRVSGSRVTYLLNNRNPRWHSVKCWVCGNKRSPPNAANCTYCSRPLGPRRFVMTARWDVGSALQFQAYAHRRLTFRGLATPLALYRYEEQLLTCYAWSGDQILLGEPAPLPSRTVLSIGFQIADALATLHAHGVVLSRLGPEHVLIGQDGAVRLFDLEIERLVDRPLPPSTDPLGPPQRDLHRVASLLAGYLLPEDAELRAFLRDVRLGAHGTADDLAAAVSAFAWRRRSLPATGRAAVMTDAGVARTDNQDAWLWRTVGPDLWLYAVADGMGGLDAGAEASQLALRTLARTLSRHVDPDNPPGSTDLVPLLRHAAQQAGRDVYRRHKDTRRQMGTTLVAFLRSGATGVVANVGDSRAYLLRAGALRQLTEDHTVVAAMVAAGRLAPEQAASHPKAGLLLNALGSCEETDPDCYEFDLQPGDRILLSSDGLHGEVDSGQLTRILRDEPDPRRAVRQLVRAANDEGGRDNITALIVDV